MHSRGTGSVRVCLPVLVSFISALTAGAQSPSRITGTVDNAQRITLTGSVHPLARPENDKGTAPASLPIERMLLVLKRGPEQERTLQSLIAAQHDPQSPSFHKWLTPDDFGKQFGAAPADVAQVSRWLQENGFQVNKVYRGATAIEFSGTAADVQQVFHTPIHKYQVSGKSYWANAAAPQIPAALAPVVAGIASLHNFTKHPVSRVMGLAKSETTAAGTTRIVPVKPDATFNGSNFVAPGDFWTIYNATPLITASKPVDGAGTTIAIAGRSDVLLSDITQFRSTLLPAPFASTVPFNQIENGPDPGSVEGDNVENTLDVEWASAVAPGATVDLVVSKTTASTDGVDLSLLYIVDNNLASVMSDLIEQR